MQAIRGRNCGDIIALVRIQEVDVALPAYKNRQPTL